jgi:hypothetical protein
MFFFMLVVSSLNKQPADHCGGQLRHKNKSSIACANFVKPFTSGRSGGAS